VRALPVGDHVAWVSDVDEPARAVTARRLHEHDAVLACAVAAGLSPMPALVGRTYGSDSTLIAALEPRAVAIGEALDLVRGRVEMSLLVATRPGEPLAGDETSSGEVEGAGRRHLGRIRSQLHGERNLRDAATVLAQSIATALGPLIVAERIVEDAAPPVLVGRAHLIARDAVAHYVELVERTSAGTDHPLRVAVRGPGAAYSFAAVQLG
jgi:hypothetical protein